MDIQESLCAVLNALTELKKNTPRALLVDFVLGNDTPQIRDKKLDDLESYGNADQRDDNHINQVLDQAIADKYIKNADNLLTIAAKGKKFLKNPVPYELREEEVAIEPEEIGLNDLDPIGPSASAETIGEKAKIKIELIKAIDRKIALDEFAEQQNMDFEELLDEVEDLMNSGTNVDISYFVDEVLGKECIEELCDYFDEVNGDLNKTQQEYGDVYQPEEIRLARLMWKK